MYEALREIGLTDSEAKVYLALLKLGPTQKGQILKETKTAPSKIYHVIQKLIDKGLVSYFNKNNVKQFKAASPENIKEYIAQKKKNLEKQEKKFSKIIPQLKKLHESPKKEPTAEIFYGWRGLETIHNDVYNTLSEGETDFVFGASKGGDTKKIQEFFIKQSFRKKRKEIKIKAIFNENSREHAEITSRKGKSGLVKKFLPTTVPVEVNVYGDKVAIINLRKQPLIFLIKDKETAEAFREYFKELWKIAKH